MLLVLLEALFMFVETFIAMKVLSEYFLMVVLTLLLNRVCIFANVMFNLDRET